MVIVARHLKQDNFFLRWGLSAAVLLMLAFMSYLTTTFMIESMAAANAMINWKRSKIIKRAESVTADDDDSSVTSDGDARAALVG